MQPEALRVLIVGINYWPEPTGIAPYTTAVAEGLRQCGHSVEVLTSFPHYPGWELADGLPWRRRERVQDVLVHRRRHYVPNRPTLLARLAFEMSFAGHVLAHRNRDADVVIAVSPALFSCTAVFVKCRLIPGRPALGLVVQDLYSSGVVETDLGGGIVARVTRWLESATARLADGVAVIHERFASQVADRLGVDAARIRVIRNWTHVQPQAAFEDFDREEFRRSMGWSTSDVIVLHAGAIGAKQGLENVVAAAALADGERLPVQFVLLGDGGQRRTLEQMSIGVERVQFLKPLDEGDFQRALRASDVLLVNERPGICEMAVPSKLTSYFNAGRPVLAATEANSTTAVELTRSRAGLRVDPGNPQALLAALLELVEDPALCDSLAANGVGYAEAVLSAKHAIGAYADWVCELARLPRKDVKKVHG